MQIKTIIAGAIAGICLAAPVFAGPLHRSDYLQFDDTGRTVIGYLDGHGNRISGGVDSTVDPYTAAARAEEARRDRAAQNARLERQGKIKRDLARADAKATAKHNADKASRSKRSNREKSASRERRRDK